MIKLSILIPTLPQRFEMYEALRDNLMEQMGQYAEQIELLTDDHETDTIGTKRNRLLQEANGEYVCFIDDDDKVSSSYVWNIMEALHANPGVDCCSLRGVITFNGKDPKIFEHSVTYHAYRTNEDPNASITYERYPNHLNCIKASIAKQFTFPEINHGEDTDWATQIHLTGKIKTEAYIDKVLYHYLFIPNKK